MSPIRVTHALEAAHSAPKVFFVCFLGAFHVWGVLFNYFPRGAQFRPPGISRIYLGVFVKHQNRV